MPPSRIAKQFPDLLRTYSRQNQHSWSWVAAVIVVLAGARKSPIASERRLRRTRLRTVSPGAPILTASSTDNGNKHVNAWGAWLIEYLSKELELVDDPDAPEEYLNVTGRRGASICTRVLKSAAAEPLARRLRVTLVHGGGEIQAMNAVLYPNSDFGCLPIFGVDMIAMNHGKRLLFGIDWAPAFPDAEYHMERIEPFLSDLLRKHKSISTDPSGRFYGNWPEFFSRSMFFARPENIDLLRPGTALWEVFEGYCTRYVNMLRSSSLSGYVDTKDRLISRSRQDDYDRWHSERDPALRVFTRLFGKDWTHAFTNEVLFPGATASAAVLRENLRPT